jgi:hypothetical protein
MAAVELFEQARRFRRLVFLQQFFGFVQAIDHPPRQGSHLWSAS